MSLCVPSAVSMLPENNKTTAKWQTDKADSDCVHKIAFLKEVSEEFGTKPPPMKYAHSVLRSSASSLADLPKDGTTIASRTKPCEWPGVLEPILRHLDVHALDDGGMEQVQRLGKELIVRHRLRDNFYAIDLGRLHRLYLAFVRAMPRVTPFYAVKCNPDPLIMRCLAALGCGFDCASAKEMGDVLSMGVPASRIVFAHACKRPADLEYAVAANVLRMTFDCADELYKIAEECPQARLILRIRADDPSAVVQLGCKYGAEPDAEAPALLDLAKALNLDVVGVSFHVGSGSQSPDSYRGAIEASARVMAAGTAAGFEMGLLDIGGGFMGRFDVAGDVPLQGVAHAINDALARSFPPDSGVDVIAEPGRYFSEACATMFSLVHTVKRKAAATAAPPAAAAAARHGGTVPPSLAAATATTDAAVEEGAVEEEERRSYFITDGVYGSFNGIIYDHGSVAAKVLRGPALPPPSTAEVAARARSTVFGPTCDGVDLIFKDVPMPHLRRGDWLQFPNFGAYSIAGACSFNGLPVDVPERFYVWSREPVGRLEGRVRVLRRRSGGVAAGVPEEDLCFVGDLHDLDSIC